MKRCPECRRDYYDETLLYCLDDGAALLEGPATADPGEPRTAILHDTGSPSEAKTRAQMHTTASPSAISDITIKKRVDKRLVLIPLSLAVIILGGFFAYRYVTPAKQIESIAVMPFVNESGNPDIEYLSDGMTDTLINNLSRIPKLSVKARSSVFKYKGKEVEPQRVAADLNVQAVVNGRVMQRGNDLTLNLEMVDARTGDQIWGEQYIRKVGDLVALQSDIARDVSNKLRQKLTGADTERISKRGTENTEAYQLYLKGRFYWNKRTIDDINKSVEYFEQAIALDPSYALAYAGLADSYVTIPSYSNNRSKETYPKARAAALKALEIDDSLAQAHTTLACVLYEFDWKFADAENEFKRAIELDPNYATAHHWYAEYLLSMWRRDDALAEIKRAQECDPLSLIINSILGVTYLVRQEYSLAEMQLKKTIEMDPNFSRAHLFLGNVYEDEGKFDEANAEYEKADLLDGVPPAEAARRAADIGKAYRSQGPLGYWRATLALGENLLKTDPDHAPPYIVFARLSVLAGDHDKAFAYLERSFEAREPDLLRLDDPALDPIRNDPRYQSLIHRIGLPN